MDNLLKDVRFAFRALTRRPAFTAIAVITLALGIGANTAIFSVVYGVLLQPLHYPDPSQLVVLRESNTPKQPDSQVAPGNFLQWQQQNTVYSELVAYRTVSYNLTGDGDPERLLAGRVSAGVFKMFGVQPLLGRVFLAEEDQPGREKVALIGEGLWQRRFGADRNLLGQTLKLSGENFTVIGVVPEEFRLPDQKRREVWTPLALTESERGLHHARYLEAMARLKPEVSVTAAQAEMTAIAGRLAQAHPAANDGWSIKVASVVDHTVGDARKTLWVLFGAVGFVLLIACANVTNLLLARAGSRQKEIAIRAAVGAGRLRIIRQLATESILLALLGGLAGWPIAVWGLKLLLAIAPPDLPRLTSVAVDTSALLFTLGVALATALIFGLVPALQLAKTNAGQILKDGGSEGQRSGKRYAGNLLIVAEVALALVLLIGGTLWLRSLWNVYQINPGFNEQNAVAVTLQLSEKKYADSEQIARFSEQLVQEVSTFPEVQAAGVARIMPIVHDLLTDYYIEGQPRPRDEDLPYTNYSAVSAQYFKAMGIPLISGRAFTDRDTKQSPRVAIVSARFAEEAFRGENPIGKRINVTTGQESFREIVGVVGDVKQKGIADRILPHVYEPFAQAPTPFMTLVVRSSSDPSALVPAIRSKVLALDHELPLQRVTTLDQIVPDSIRKQRFASRIMTAFAVVALLLAMAGLYGVVSYSVAQRTRELGIRVALGAQVTDVLGLVLKQGMSFVLLGELVGLVAAYLLNEILEPALYGVTSTDISTYVAVAVFLFLIALIACYVPARRATRVDPLQALRYE
jgi:putative ABC transport system permease protein